MLIELDQFDWRDIEGFGPRIVVEHRCKQHAGEDDNAPIHGLDIRISHRREEYHDESENQEHQRQDIDEKAPSAQRKVLAPRRFSSADSQIGHLTN